MIEIILLDNQSLMDSDKKIRPLRVISELLFRSRCAKGNSVQVA